MSSVVTEWGAEIKWSLSSIINRRGATRDDLASHWQFEEGAHGWGNDEIQDYRNHPENCFIRPRANETGNELVLKALVNHGTRHFSSARLTTWTTLGVCGGRGYLEATIRWPSAAGVWPAFWMLPKWPFEWPRDGEIDIFEVWNAENINHSCLHWGHFNEQDRNKHRVLQTKLVSNGLSSHTFGFAWDETAPYTFYLEDGRTQATARGRLVWYINRHPVMKAMIPEGIRSLSEYQLKANIAMAGRVQNHVQPKDGEYELVFEEITLSKSPPEGWQQFYDSSFEGAPHGNPTSV